MSVFEAIGGKEIVRTITNDFYERLRSDKTEPPVWRHFDGKTEERIEEVKAGTANFIGALIGGPGGPVSMRNLRQLHEDVDITQQDYDIAVNHLVGAFEAAEANDAIPVIAPFVPMLGHALVK